MTRVALVTLVLLLAVVPLRPSTSLARLTATKTVGSNAVSSASWCRYTSAIENDTPALYWRFSETTGTTTKDWSNNGRTGSLKAGVTLGVTPSPVTCDSSPALGLNGTGTWAVYQTTVALSNNMSIEGWVQTTSTTGGRIAGFGSSSTTASTATDRVLWFDDSGFVHFGVTDGTTKRVVDYTAGVVNDGNWHHVVGTMSSTAGITVYVDGVQGTSNAAATTGLSTAVYPRIGSDVMTGFTPAPTQYALTGNVDEFAYYTSTLSAAQVLNHYRAATQAVAPLTCTYDSSVLADAPDYYYRLDETTGATYAQDSSGGESQSQYLRTPHFGQTGVTPSCAGTAAINSVSATEAGWAIQTNRQNASPGPAPFTLEMWIKVPSGSYGRLVGAQDVQGLSPTNYDRLMYIDTAGKLDFGCYNGAVQTVVSASAVTDNAWHHVVATLSPSAGMVLYVDGAVSSSNASVKSAQSYASYWRIGAGFLSGNWPNHGTDSTAIDGLIDNVAIWNSKAIPLSRVQAHYAARG